MPIAGSRLCGAKTKSGGRCRQAAIRNGNGRCRMHNGAAAVGPAASQWKHGRYSRYLPADLAAAYRESLNDPSQLALNHELALVDSRIAQLLERLDRKGGPSRPAVRASVERLRQVLRVKLGRDADTLLAELTAVLETAGDEQRLWGQLHVAIGQRGRLADVERKRLEAAEKVLTEAQALALVGALADTVRRNVTDREALRRINEDITRVLRPSRLPEPPADSEP